jgi:hypothetical protein
MDCLPILYAITFDCLGVPDKSAPIRWKDLLQDTPRVDELLAVMRDIYFTALDGFLELGDCLLSLDIDGNSSIVDSNVDSNYRH